MVRLLVIILLILLVLGLMPAWPYSRSWGWYPSGGVGLLLIVAIVALIVLGDRRGRLQ